MGLRYKNTDIEHTIWKKVGNYYPRRGDRIAMFFPGRDIPVVLTTYDDWDNWVPRPTHWARTLTGPAVPR